MVVFYVHDEADCMDVVLRNQVANTIFIFLPKIVTVLYQTSIADGTVGETIKRVSNILPLIKICHNMNLFFQSLPLKHWVAYYVLRTRKLLKV